MKRQGTFILGVLCGLALIFGVAAASAAMSRTWVNDFEKTGDDTPAGGWYTDPPTTITRTPSGAAATYASGIQSAHGKWHARLSPNDPCPKLQLSFACQGPYTFWGKSDTFNPVFPNGGYVTEIDVYLDVNWMTQSPATTMDTRFDWDSAINDQAGNFRRDFVFNAGTPLTAADTAAMPGYYVNASTNAFRSGAFPENPCPSPSTAPNYCRSPVKITVSGWYTFRHYFHLVTIGSITYLAVDMSVLRPDKSVVASWTIYDQQDAAGFGGDSYGWFVINEFQDLAADCSAIHPPGMKHPKLCKFARTNEGGECDKSSETDNAEQADLARINSQRAAVLLLPLTLNTTSSDATRKHSCDESGRNDQHQDASGASTASLIPTSGAPLGVNAENFGFADGSTATDALAGIQWDLAADPTSIANILNPAFTQVGIGAVYQNGTMWLTEDFAG
jgi:uncharacterized protein YkwD